MGMYTELVVSTRVQDDPEVIAILSYMGGKTAKPPTIPDHPFFKTHRWEYMFQSASYYFVPSTTFVLEHDAISKDWSLIVRCDFKNYDNEIEHFVSWIRPHLDRRAGGMFAYSRYEESPTPTIHYEEGGEELASNS